MHRQIRRQGPDHPALRALRKLGRSNGETLIETMASMVIVVLGALVLAGAITASARVNRVSGDMATFAQETIQSPLAGATAPTSGEEQITVTYGGTSSTIDVSVRQDGGLHYYVPKTQTKPDNGFGE